MIRKILLGLLILIATTSAVEAAEEKSEPTFKERTANLAEMQAIRVGYGSGTVRIVIDITKKVDFNESYVENPSRVIIDLRNTWLSPKVQKEIELKSLTAKKIRIAQYDPTTVRVVVETMADVRPFYLSGGAAGYRFVIDVGNAEYKENPELNKPEPPKPVTPPKSEIPSDIEIVDPEDQKLEQQRKQEQALKEQREREQALKEQQERELKEQREREIKEQREREQALKEQQERELKEQREREKELKEKQERELKEQREREKALKEKQERELKEKREREIKEQREREKALKEKQEREKREKKNKDKKSKDKEEEEKTVDKPFGDLENDLDKITALSGKIIVIDPGHGGNDSGAIGPTGVMEKNVTLKVALELRKLLEAEGAKVILTRETDRTVSEKGAKASDIEELGARCDVGNRAGADIFISIHADSFTRPEARGTTGYYYSKSTTGRGQKLADCIRRNLARHAQSRNATLQFLRREKYRYARYAD